MSSVGLVHDYLLVMRGAERTFAAIAECWPDAPIYTLLYDARRHRAPLRAARGPHLVPAAAAASARGASGGCCRSSRARPSGCRSASTTWSSRAAAPSLTACGRAPGAVHVCYCHSPFRYAWHERERALDEAPRLLRPLLRLDRSTGSAAGTWPPRARSTHYIANSELTRERIAALLGARGERRPSAGRGRALRDRRARGLLPGRHRARPPQARRPRAGGGATRAGSRIKVVGTGPDSRAACSAATGRGAEFLGRVSDAELAEPLLPRQGAGRAERRGVRDRRGGGPGGRPAGASRPTPAGPARRSSTARPECWSSPAPSTRSPRRWRRRTSTASRPRAIKQHAERFSPGSFQKRFRAEIDERMEADRLARTFQRLFVGGEDPLSRGARLRTRGRRSRALRPISARSAGPISSSTARAQLSGALGSAAAHPPPVARSRRAADVRCHDRHLHRHSLDYRRPNGSSQDGTSSTSTARSTCGMSSRSPKNAALAKPQ